MKGYTHAEVDKLEETLRLSCRVAEGLEQSHAKLAQEIAGLESELREAESQVQQRLRAEALIELRNQLEQAARLAAEAMDNARRNLALLHLAAAKAVDEYSVDALRICEQVFAEFGAKQTNLEARGLKRVTGGYQNTAETGVFIRPMVRAEAPCTVKQLLQQ